MEKEASEEKEVEMVVLSSGDGDYPWEPVPPQDVPDWIKNDPRVVGNLVDGQMARRGQGLWYRAEVIN